MYHYESKSRGLEDTPEKVERFNGEIATFAQKWPEILNTEIPIIILICQWSEETLDKITRGEAMRKNELKN